MPGPDDPPMANIEVDLYLHVRVLIAIIIALSVTRLLGGVAQFMRQSDNHRVSWIHLAWVAWVFFNVIAFWWWEFRLSQVTHWTFALYLFVIAYASMFFLQAALLFPTDIEGYDGYGDYFISRRAWFFGIFAVTEVMDVVDTLIKGTEHLRALGTEYLVRNAVFLALCLVAARTPNLKFHRLFAAGGLAYEVIYIYRQYFSLF
jgi:hypothetical protein